MVYENVMVETGAESNGTIEIKTALDPTKKLSLLEPMPLSEYKFRKGNDPMAGMKM
jgi:Cu(I)/Ag(I) efflux system membrane fusion protein